MKNVIVVLLLSLVITQSLNAAETSRSKLTDRLIKAFDIEKSTSFNIDQIVDIIIKKEPQFTPYRDVLVKFYTKHLTWTAIKPVFEKIILMEFSEPDLIVINQFLENPAFKAWVATQGDIEALPEDQQSTIMDFVSSDTGIRFFKVTEEFVTISKKFIGNVTFDNKKELDQMINEKTQELVK